MSDQTGGTSTEQQAQGTEQQSQQTEQKPQGGDATVLELMLDGKATKVPLEAVNPHLAKLRAEADRRMSEADRRAKELDAERGRYSQIERLAAAAKQDPRIMRELAKELGVTREQMRALAEEDIAEALREQLRDEEEKKDPAKREARETREELEQLRRDRAELERLRQEREVGQYRQGTERMIINAIEAGKFPVGLRSEAAREMIPVIRAAVAACKDPNLNDFALTPAQLAEAAKKALRTRAAAVYDDPEAEFSEAQLKRAEALLAKRRGAGSAHPAAAGRGGTNGTTARERVNPTPPATDIMLQLLRGGSG